MIRLVFSLIVITAIASGLALLADMPGGISMTIAGMKIETSLAVGAVILVGLTIVLSVTWSIIRFFFRLPKLISIGWSAHRKHKGHLAVSRGMIAVGSGDAKLAHRNAVEATKLLGAEPLALLLAAQAAQMEGDSASAARAFRAMLAEPDTRLLGLRGLFVEAQRAGHDREALSHAEEAARLTPKSTWAVEALIEHHARQGDWHKALMALDRGSAAYDKAERKRKRAVLLTAESLAFGDGHPDQALASAKEAAKLAPDLVPAQIAYAELLSRHGDYRKASRTLEAAWKLSPHPDLGEAYLAVRPGDAARERLIRAKKLCALNPGHFESQFLLARAFFEARDFAKARETITPLLEAGATVRLCLLMAELEHLEHGDSGGVKEWLGRASHAPRDPCWVGDGIVTEKWTAVSPLSGKLDGLSWAQPVELSPDRRTSRVLDGALRSLPFGKTPAELENRADRPAPGLKKTLSAAAFLASQTPDAEAPIASPPRSSDVIFPLAHPPDDPGPAR
jgi:HemY protein